MNTAKKKSVFAVCDTEMEYARNFMEYLNQKRNIPFEVHAFSSAEMFLEFAKNNETEILLISDKAMKEEIRRYPIRQIIILSEGVHSPVLDQYPAVYKYQSSEKVIREVMACYGVENGVDTSPALLPKKEMRIIGIYSPVGRTQKTSFALTMGQILAKERAVLYLNMESYSSQSQSVTYRDTPETETETAGETETDENGNVIAGSSDNSDSEETHATQASGALTYQESDGTFVEDADGNRYYTDKNGNVTYDVDSYNYVDSNGDIITDGYGYIDPYTGAYIQ